MKTDLDQIMAARGLDGLLITGPGQYNPAMVYFTGPAMLTHADLVVRRGEAPLLYCHPMERDAAARTGLRTSSYLRFPLAELIKEAGGDRARAQGLRYARMLAEAGLSSGRVAVYGKVEIGPAWGALTSLREALPGIELVGEAEDAVLMQARATKSPDEVEHIRAVGQATLAVVAELQDYLTTRPVKEGCLTTRTGNPLTIGQVKGRIERWCIERGLENPEGTIFSIGRDAAVPHNPGNPAAPLRLGQTIVLDIYPREKGGGYFYDFTRTWCLGFAPEEAQSLYDHVLGVYRQMRGEYTAGKPGALLQQRACELFEGLGHPTLRTDPETETGYVHGLGHGVGLDIHEKPWVTGTADDTDVLRPGSVVTLEPGLYYPERGLGVRLEDTLWIAPDGMAQSIVDFPMELVLPVRPQA
ncbi:MAG TPA: M24 family metallopeptidase [Anaerolineaceae bacterium]